MNFFEGDDKIGAQVLVSVEDIWEGFMGLQLLYQRDLEHRKQQLEGILNVGPTVGGLRS